MPGSRPKVVGLATLAVGAFVGCQTARPVLAPEPQTAGVRDLDPSEAQFAQGLAYYAQGLLHDYEGRFDAALTNYLHAVELDASNEELSIRIAMGLLQQKRPEEAIRIMETLVREHAESEKALAFMALVYQAAGRTDQVRDTFERWLKLTPRSAAPYLQFAKFLRRHGEPKEVEELMRQGIRKVKEPAPLRIELAKHILELADEAEGADEAARLRRDALEHLGRAVEDEAEDAALMRQIGQQAIRLGDARTALKWFARIEQLRPHDLTIKHQLALDFVPSGKVEEGVRMLEAVVAAEPDHRQAHYYLGELYLRRDAFESAVSAFRRAMDSDPLDSSAAIRLALTQLEPDPQSAIETLETALTHAPEEPRLLELLGHAQLAREQPGQAVQAFARALEHAGTDNPPAQFFYHFARAAYLAGDVDRAIRLLWRTLDENLAYLQLFMRESLAETGDEPSDRVVAFFEAFAATYSDEPAAHLHLGMLKNHLERFEEALLHFSEAMALAEQHHRNTQILNEDFYFAYGAAQERTGRIDEAARMFQTALAIDPHHENAHNYLAYMWAERGMHLDQALAHVRKALAIEPDSGPFLDTLGWIYYMQGRYEDALREIQKAARLIPDDPTITDHLGDVLWKLDRRDDALEQWKKSYRLNPDNQKVAEKLREQGVDPKAVLAEADPSAKGPRKPVSTLPLTGPEASAVADPANPLSPPGDAALPDAGHPVLPASPPAETNAQPKL